MAWTWDGTDWTWDGSDWTWDESSGDAAVPAGSAQAAGVVAVPSGRAFTQNEYPASHAAAHTAPAAPIGAISGRVATAQAIVAVVDPDRTFEAAGKTAAHNAVVQGTFGETVALALVEVNPATGVGGVWVGAIVEQLTAYPSEAMGADVAQGVSLVAEAVDVAARPAIGAAWTGGAILLSASKQIDARPIVVVALSNGLVDASARSLTLAPRDPAYTVGPIEEDGDTLATLLDPAVTR